MIEKIPKIIHYCWFGNREIPKFESKCIKTWRNLLPDYEFVLWNEDNFDVRSNEWVRKAYEEKKYAFVADYVRLYALIKYGGIYLDTDVKMLKSFDNLLHLDGFMCFEDLAGELIATCVIGMKKGHEFLEELLEYYNRDFDADDIVNNFKSNALMFTEKLKSHGLQLNGQKQIVKEISIFPRTYFCPMDYFSNWDKTEDTYCIHLFSGSWLPESEYNRLAGRRKLWWRIGKYIYVHLKRFKFINLFRNYLKNREVI